MIHIPFDNRFVQLGEPFFTKAQPTPVAGPSLIRFNVELARALGMSVDGASEADLAHLFTGNALPAGAEPVAMAYAGHQFGHFVPQLGDGRAIWLGEFRAPDGQFFDVQLKGSGRTAYSRGGDGRAALGPVLREYLVSEAMHRLGVPTTRALAAVATGEEVARERLLPGGVITRVAASFVRVGTFEYFAARGDGDAVKRLADYVIARNHPELAATEQPYEALLAAVIARQARLIAQWMQIGFIHGVMNTDNMSVAGETIDYGPCAFMDGYAHQRVFSSIDRGGRYAYASQPGIGLWNLVRLAETLLPLLAQTSDDAVAIAQAHLQGYKGQYDAAWLAPGAGRRPARRDGRGRGGFHAHLRSPLSPGHRRRRSRRRGARAVRAARAVRRVARPLARTPGARAARRRCAAGRHEGGEPGVRPAQSPDRGGDPGRGGPRGLLGVSRAARGAGESVHRTARKGTLPPAAPAGRSGVEDLLRDVV